MAAVAYSQSPQSNCVAMVLGYCSQWRSSAARTPQVKTGGNGRDRVRRSDIILQKLTCLEIETSLAHFYRKLRIKTWRSSPYRCLPEGRSLSDPGLNLAYLK